MVYDSIRFDDFHCSKNLLIKVNSLIDLFSWTSLFARKLIQNKISTNLHYPKAWRRYNLIAYCIHKRPTRTAWTTIVQLLFTICYTLPHRSLLLHLVQSISLVTLTFFSILTKSQHPKCFTCESLSSMRCRSGPPVCFSYPFIIQHVKSSPWIWTSSQNSLPRWFLPRRCKLLSSRPNAINHRLVFMFYAQFEPLWTTWAPKRKVVPPVFSTLLLRIFTLSLPLPGKLPASLMTAVNWPHQNRLTFCYFSFTPIAFHRSSVASGYVVADKRLQVTSFFQLPWAVMHRYSIRWSTLIRTHVGVNPLFLSLQNLHATDLNASTDWKTRTPLPELTATTDTCLCAVCTNSPPVEPTLNTGKPPLGLLRSP